MKSLMSTFCLAGALLLLSAATYAQTGSVSGTITEATRGLTLAGASIRVEGQPMVAVSDDNGHYVLQGIRAGKIKITASYLGLQDLTQEIDVAANTTTSWDAKLSVPSQGYTVDVAVETEDAGQARALNDQKNSINQINLVASDQIGSFPDPNAAEAIQRVPGIVVQRDQGEGRYVLIRGTEPRLSATTINGERIGTTENTSRQIPLDTIPADLMGAIEVTKAFTPDMEGDSIGGRVNLVTKRAPAKQQIGVTIASGVNSMVSRDIKEYNGTYGNSFYHGKLGFIGSGGYYETNRGSQDLEPSWTGTLALNGLDLRDYHLTRKRYGGTGDLTYRINPGSEIYFRGLRSEYTDRELRYRLNEGVANSRLERLLRQRFHDSTQLALMFGGNHTLPNSWTVNWRTSYSEAELNTPYRLESSFRATGSITFLPNATPSSVDPDNVQANPQNQNLNNFNFRQNAIQNDHGFERNAAAGIDVSAPTKFSTNTVGLTKFGFKIRDANRTRDVQSITQTPKSGVTIKLVDNGQADYAPPHDYLGGKYVEFGTLFPDPDKMQALSHDGSSFNTVIAPDGDSGSYRAKERVFAGYVMEEIYFGDKTTLQGGVRFEGTNTTYSAPQYQEAGGTITGRSIFDGKNDYLNILPSINLRYQVFKDTPFRISFSRSLARPNYADLAPFVLRDTTALTVSKGNPDLKVTTADNFDVSLEHYFKSVGVASGGFFYKHIDKYIYTTTTTETIDGNQYQVTQPINGDAANLYGIELTLVRQFDFLPGALKGIDIYANYTHTHSSATLPRGKFILPSQAADMANFAVGYGIKGFNIRLSENFQGKYPLAINASESLDNWLDDRLETDLSIGQRFGKHVKVYADLLNLGNQPYRVYQGTKDTSDRAIQEERYRMWAIIGVKLNF